MILIADKLITGDGKSVLDKSGVLVRDGKIIEVEKAEGLTKLYPGESVHDYGDATLLPGLIDMHFHVGFWWRQHDSRTFSDMEKCLLGLYQAQNAFKNGVTTLRDVFCPDHVSEVLTAFSAKGYFTIPRIFYCNKAICVTAGQGNYFYGGAVEIDGEVNAIRAVREQIKTGATWIKVMTNRNDGPCQFTNGEFATIVEEAHKWGCRVAAHATSSDAIEKCIEVGVDSIEHAACLTVEQAKRMCEKNIALCPTMWSFYYYPETEATIQSRNLQAERFLEIANTGVTVVTGTDMIKEDAPIAPASQEVKKMVEYGLDICRAIQAATYNSAKVLGHEHEFGSIEKGLYADILVVNGDLSADISKIDDICQVFLAGKTVYTA